MEIVKYNKWCYQCEQDLDISEFNTFFSPWCKQCVANADQLHDEGGE